MLVIYNPYPCCHDHIDLSIEIQTLPSALKDILFTGWPAVHKENSKITLRLKASPNLNTSILYLKTAGRKDTICHFFSIMTGTIFEASESLQPDWLYPALDIRVTYCKSNYITIS